MSIVDHVEYTGLQRSVESICSKFDSGGGWDAVKVAAALHHYVRYSVEGKQGGDEVKDLPGIVEEGGDCREKSVFLASLLSHVSRVDCRFVEIAEPDENYIFLQVSFPDREIKEITRCLEHFYGANTDWHDISFIFEEREDVFWYFCDPFSGQHIGDISSLQDTSFMVIGDGQYSIYQCDVEFHEV